MQFFFKITTLVVLLFSITGTLSSQTCSTTNTAVPAANIVAGSTKNPIYRFVISGVNNEFMDIVNFQTTGTYDAKDITSFDLYTNTVDDLSTATPVVNVTTGLDIGMHTFNPYVEVTDNYFWITVDVAATPTIGNTITVAAFNANDPSVVVQNDMFFVGCYDGGTQTISNATAIDELKGQFSFVSINTYEQGKDFIINFDAIEGDDYYFSLYNNLGQMINAKSGKTISGINKLHINNCNLTQGIYLVTLHNGKESFGKKVFIK